MSKLYREMSQLGGGEASGTTGQARQPPDKSTRQLKRQIHPTVRQVT